jgi:hypothetical protein
MTYWITKFLLYFNYFLEGMDMFTNISEASTNPMAPTTQQAPTVTVGSFISTASGIPMASGISEGIQLDSTILARFSTIPVGSLILDAIPVHSDISVHSAIPVQSGIPETFAVPPPKSLHFTPAAPTVLIPTAPIPAPVPGQTIVSPTWLKDPLRYMTVIISPSCVPPETLITHEIEADFLHVS